MVFGKNDKCARRAFAFGTFVFCALGLGALSGFSQGFTGAVYAMTNQPSGNSIVAFGRAPSGVLSMVGDLLHRRLGFGSGNDPLAMMVISYRP